MSARHYVVSGTRTELTDLDEILIRASLEEYGLDDTESIDFIHVGDCPTGVDAFIPRLVEEWPLQYRRHEADWSRYGRAAGPIRNRAMLDVEPYRLSQCWAFPRQGAENRGTKDFVKACLERGADLRIVWLPRGLPET